LNKKKECWWFFLSKKSKKDNLSCYEPFPREQPNSFEKFLAYRDLPPHERSTRKVAEKFAMGKNGSEFKKIHRNIERLCTKWCWVERCKIYDADRQLELAQKRDAKFDELSDVMLKNVDGLIKYANNLLTEVIKSPLKNDGEEYSLMSRIQMSRDVTSLLNSSHELLCNLCGRPSSYKNFEFNGGASIEHKVPFAELERVVIESGKKSDKEKRKE
jgi:hypothetical protein